jgi:DNA-binding transcriptional LysR family regulator
MRHLRAFLAVADELHFGRAARRLHIVQPAVSTAIRELERELGAVLFDRTRRVVRLSAAGAQFRIGAEAALAALDQGGRAALRAARGEIGQLVILFTPLAAMAGFPAAIASFRRDRPDVEIVIRQRSTQEQLDELRAGRCDLAIAIEPGEVRPFSSATIDAAPLVVAVPARHALTRRRRVRFSDIVGEPMLILPRATEPAVSRAYHGLCAAAGVEPTIAMELEQAESMLAFVAAGVGIALLPGAVAELRPRGVALLPLVPTRPTRFTVMWDPERLTPAGRALLDELRPRLQ